jgi:hypothetical protein
MNQTLGISLAIIDNLKIAIWVIISSILHGHGFSHVISTKE